jgi:GAF domain-containing protein
VGSRPREGAGADAAVPGPVEELLAAARDELRMDAALLSEVREGREVVLWAVGNGRVPPARGVSIPLADTVCRHLLDGTITNVVPDTGRVPVLRDLPVVRAAGYRSYIGVAIGLAGGAQFVLCCVSNEVRPGLGGEDVRFLEGLADQLRPVLGRAVRPV